MPPLTRQRTRESILSWWSDSNPTGPNINLHAAAKPLMRRMYDRQALSYIKTNQGSPLSVETMEIYSSYLAFKYVSPSTKVTILREIDTRARSKDDACTAILDPALLSLIGDLLESSEPDIRILTCEILGRAVPNAPPAVATRVCPQLLWRLRRDENITVIARAAEALHSIAASADGAQASVDANFLDCLAELLRSPDKLVRTWTCRIVGELARNRTTLPTVLSANPCEHLISLLHDTLSETAEKALNWLTDSPDGAQAAVQDALTESAAEALTYILETPEGARDAMHGKVFDCISELIHTPHHSWGRRMVAVLGSHDTAVSNALDLTQCKLLVSFLQDKDSQVKEWAVGRMYTLTESPGGGQAALDIDVFAVTRLIQSPNMDVRRWTGEILGRLADLDATATTGAISVANLVSSLLHDENFQIIHSAVYTLYKLTKSAQGAQAVINANVLDYTAELLESPEPKVREYMREMIGQLARQRIWGPLFGTSACRQLGLLLRDENSAISECAAEALYWITETPAGVQAVLNADVLDCVVDLLESHNRNWAKRMLEDHEIHVAEALSTRHSKQHTSFFRETDNKVIKSTVGTLYKITASLEGIQAALDANIFSCLAELLQSPNSDVRGWACQILGRLAIHNSTEVADAIPFTNLVASLLHDENVQVIQSAAYALHKIANSPQGVQVVLDANVLVSVTELLASGNPRVQRWTRGMLKALASHLTTHLSRHTELYARGKRLPKSANIRDGVGKIAATDVLGLGQDIMEPRWA